MSCIEEDEQMYIEGEDYDPDFEYEMLRDRHF